MWALRRGWCFFCSTAVIIGSSLRRALHLYKSRIEIALTDCLKLYGSKVAVERRPLSALDYRRRRPSALCCGLRQTATAASIRPCIRPTKQPMSEQTHKASIFVQPAMAPLPIQGLRGGSHDRQTDELFHAGRGGNASSVDAGHRNSLDSSGTAYRLGEPSHF
jgi:hypothetical protein